MSRKDDLIRALEYGRDPYFAEIQNSDAYARELQRLNDTRPDKSWIQSPFQLPRFTTPEFEAQRARYIAKYGYRISIPGFEDVFQWRPRTPISNEEMTAHRYAQRYGLPSPLNADQIEELTRKKKTFLRMLSAPEGSINRGATAVMTAMDNANDALFTFAVLGQIATKIAPKALGRAAPIFGWAQGAADVLNLFNVAAQITKKSYSHKRMLEKQLDKNPFHKKFWTGRVERFGKRWPGLGELLQIPQVTQSMFGVGLCLGGIMGTMNDTLSIGTEQAMRGLYGIAVTLNYPYEITNQWGDLATSAALIWNAKDYVDKQTLEQVTLAASYSMQTLIPTWIQVDSPEFLEIYQHMGTKQKPAVNNATRYLLGDVGIDPMSTPNWPEFDYSTIGLDELSYTYGPKINDNFTEYLLENENDPVTRLVGEAASDYHGALITALSDDHVAQVSQTAVAGAVKDMALASLLIPPETSQATIEKLADFILQWERDHGSQPSVKDIEIKGIGLGINWTRRYPDKLSGAAAEIWPGWQAIQDQLQTIHLPDFE